MTILFSPSKDFKKFLNDEYYLTANQEDIVHHITNINGIYGISGCAGCGKTLISYDIIRKFRYDSTKHILFIFCGHLEPIHKKMAKYFPYTDFKQISELKSISLNKYNYIFIDEAQKIYYPSLKLLKHFAIKFHNTKKICFLYDPNQSLEDKDKVKLLDDFINKEDKLNNGHHYKLSTNIRCNEIIERFIRAITHKGGDISAIDINELNKHVSIKYFDNARCSCSYINHLITDKKYKFLTPTNDNNDSVVSSVNQYKNLLHIKESNNCHSNIGSDYDKVVTYADKNLGFQYNHDYIQQLNNEYYKLNNELYVNMSRAVNKLSLLIIGNKKLYNRILNIIYTNR